jgi:hypothetical protein
MKRLIALARCGIASQGVAIFAGEPEKFKYAGIFEVAPEL